MKSYTINLLRSKDRRNYIDGLLSQEPFFENEYVEGIDATLMTELQLSSCFDYESAFQRYGRDLRKGEVGCTLSHRKCYELLLKSLNDNIMIFEDDIAFSKISKPLLEKIELFMQAMDDPCILLLSGGYWYKSKHAFCEDYDLATVYSAYYTHSYIINRKAATLLLNLRPDYLADDWNLIRELGVRLMAVKPHLISQNDMGSLINTEARGLVKKNINLIGKCRAYKIGLLKKILFVMGHYEKEVI